ncbi:hypothetical protein LNP26_27630 [Klebsiella variicola subsp. variicola]|nr:hypothetical protein [Klebsiella variicola subsp. variicola]
MMVASLIQLTDKLLPAMRSRGWGRIITSTSSGVIAPIPGLAPVECAAHELARLVENPCR